MELTASYINNMEKRKIFKIAFIGVCTSGVLLYILNKRRGGNNLPPIFVVETDHVVVTYEDILDFTPIGED